MTTTGGAAGLTAAEVAERRADGRINDVPDAPVRTTGEILRANVLTPVNAIMGSLLVLILVAGFPGDALFAGVIVSNSVIGTFQELRARRILTALAVLSAPRARVVRDDEVCEVGVSEVVADELLELHPGDQVVVDGSVAKATGLELDESLLTGESDPVDKAPGDEVLSGSFVAAGSGRYRATAIGPGSYAATLAEEARRFDLVDSELRSGVDTVLRWLTVVIPPAAGLLLLRLLVTEERWHDALRGTVAAAVAMVPDGLVLLTSLSFIVGVVALARRKALARELASVELLARVDTLCLDKTGTITTGEIAFAGLEPIGATTAADAEAAVGALAVADPSPNATLAAIAGSLGDPGWTVVDAVPFSSARKWASATLRPPGDVDTSAVYHLGAPDVLLPEGEWSTASDRVAELAADGRRVLVATRSALGPDADPEVLPTARLPLCLVLLEDTVKEEAPEILAWFADQGLDLKVISGDHPATVAAVARRAGIAGAEGDRAVDARDLPDDPDALADVLEAASVFGRVTPHQKRAMVGALRSRGRTVAMTGDGVNDVLALKDADMGIAMGSGSSASRAVAQLVLLDDRFSTLPRVVAEGRRVINNIERVANLFLTKATYAVLLTALVGLFGVPFPFHPKQLTLIGSVSIGVPGFFLALAPDPSLVRPGFLPRVLRWSLPAGAAAAVATFACYEVVRRSDAAGMGLEAARTTATLTLLGVGLAVLLGISRPLRPWKVGLAAAMGGLYAIAMAWPFARDYFELVVPTSTGWAVAAACTAAGALSVALVPRSTGGPRVGNGR